MIFVNLPVADLAPAKAFYEAVGFVNNPRFSDDTAACMVWSDTICAMLVTHPKWATFTTRPIAAAGSSEVALCLTCDTPDEVHAIMTAGASVGGTVDINPPEEHGFMMTRSLGDLDGHVWEFTWMDPAFVTGETPIETEV
jgi:hypothetical protein